MSTKSRSLSFIASLILLFASSSVEAQVTKGPDSVVQLIDSVLADSALSGGIQGVIVESLKSGAVWYERNPNVYFMPASNQKLLTSAAALNLLGPDWRYTTRLLSSGSIQAGKFIQGDLFLQGTGDPLLNFSHLDEMVQAIRKADIRGVVGSLYADDLKFDDKWLGVGWSWDYLSDYYAAPVGALNVNKNVVFVHVTPGKEPGDKVEVVVKPERSGFRWTNYATTGARGSRSTLKIERALDGDYILVEGSVPAANSGSREPVRVTVTNPGIYATDALYEKLHSAGINFLGLQLSRKRAPRDATEIWRHSSPPLSEIVALMNKPSDNLIAECLMKSLGAERGSGGTTADGKTVAMRWFRDSSITENGFDMADGSGLSRLNVVTPRAMANLLRVMHSHSNSKVFLDSLPIAGVDGTLRNRMKGTPAEGNCRAKSGFIGSVSSLSGYVTTKAGEPLLFVILLNNHRARNITVTALQDRIVATLAGFTSNDRAVVRVRDSRADWD